MKYAKIISLGGELISASEADYSDYFGLMTCPECGESVFLRKAHTRNDLMVSPAFVHHKGIQNVSLCESRVLSYSRQDIVNNAAIARGQRLQKLHISMWKYLKTNLCCNLKHWNDAKNDMTRFKTLRALLDFAKDVATCNIDLMCQETMDKISPLVKSKSGKIHIDIERSYVLDEFINKYAKNWMVHTKLASEALRYFLENNQMEELRIRLLASICHPVSIKNISILMEMDMQTNEWREVFASYLTIELPFVFLTVPWLDIFEVG